MWSLGWFGLGWDVVRGSTGAVTIVPTGISSPFVSPSSSSPIVESQRYSFVLTLIFDNGLSKSERGGGGGVDTNESRSEEEEERDNSSVRFVRVESAE